MKEVATGLARRERKRQDWNKNIRYKKMQVSNSWNLAPEYLLLLKTVLKKCASFFILVVWFS